MCGVIKNLKPPHQGIIILIKKSDKSLHEFIKAGDGENTILFHSTSKSMTYVIAQALI